MNKQIKGKQECRVKEKSKTGLNYTVNESFEHKTFRLIFYQVKAWMCMYHDWENMGEGLRIKKMRQYRTVRYSYYISWILCKQVELVIYRSY